MKCFGRNASNHCCYIDGKPCQFLEENTDTGFRWSCQLRRETGSWDAAIADPRYMRGAKSPGRFFAQFSYKNCKDFQCEDCGKFERGEIDRAELDRRWP